MGFEVECTTCKKKFELKSEWHYKYRLERNKGRGIFCSAKCGQVGKELSEEHRKHIAEGLDRAVEIGCKASSPIMNVNCSGCGKGFQIKENEYHRRIRNNQRKLVFCSTSCGNIGKSPSEETREKIRSAQIGVAKPQVGRKGHVVSAETREKIRQSKLGKPSVTTWDLVVKERDLNYPNGIITRGYQPDIIDVDWENHKLIVVEVEKKRIPSAITRKMIHVETKSKFPVVHIVWYLPNGTRMDKRVYENKEWTNPLTSKTM